MVHGAKKGQQQAQKPHIAKDDLVSVENYKGLYGLAEGEIEGLADGGKSIKLDGTPLINDNGTPNFADVAWEFRAGTQDQSHIAGFVAVENETRVGVELRHDRPWVKAITNRELSAVRVRLNFNALREQDDNGNIKGYAIGYAVDVQTDGGAFVEVLTDSVRGKASSGFKRSHRIDLPKLPSTGKAWTIRVRRLTPNRDSDLISDTMSVDAITEIIDAKLRYPNTALLALTYNAKTFSNVAKVAVRLKGKIIQVPTNYNPQTRTYTGLWDGTFKLAYSNNPAWVFYDLCTHKRYGLGERLAGLVDKWRLYQIGQYCDEMVDDGKGGQEPRFTINVYIQKADDAYRVLQNIASTFRGMSFWDGSQIVLDSDTPKDPVYTFSPANVVGEFVYQGTRARDRHTFVRVAWDNPENNYQTEYEPVPDEENIAKYGMKQLDINAFGCTSRGQAQRVGLWVLKAEQLETQTVSFKTGLMGFIPQVGQVINIADNVFAGRAVSGRILAVNGKQITLDRTAGKVGDTITLNTLGQIATATITAVHGDTLTLDKTMGETGDVWAIISDDLKLMQFRVLTIAQNDDATFDITALQYDRQKYAVVDNGAIVTPQPYTVLKATPITAPNSVTLTASTRIVQGQAVTTLNINWEQVQGATAYIVEWRKDDGNWQTLPKVSGQSVDIDGVYAGKYTARVRAVDSYDNESLATSSQLTNIAGKTGKPPRLASLNVQGVLFGMNLGWGFNKGSEDTNFTEIQVSPDGRSNITTLGTFAYPTNKHEITGLQGGLTQFYRGRIVDKLGNTSDWTAWVRGVTDNQAEKVLNLISGQISESHLHTTLSTPIAKIGGLEQTMNGLTSNVANLNNNLGNALTQINLEKTKLASAIGDINVLMADKNAKTQEIANLTQTVNGHTGQMRDLVVTTGNLTQRYHELKTATDTTKSQIERIEQTTNEQALSVNRLNSRFDNLAVGGRNLLKHTQHLDQLWRFASGGQGNSMTISDGVARLTGVGSTWKHLGYDINKPTAQAWLKDGTTFTLSIYAKKISGNPRLSVALRKGITGGFKDDLVGKSFDLSSDWQKLVVSGTITPDDLQYLFARFEFWGDGVIELKKPKLEYGTVATDWTPAIDDDNAWQTLRTPTDLNTLTETGKYFLATNTTNNPITTAWSYLVVEKVSDGRITQTVWADNDNKIQYRRVKFDNAWRDWEKLATEADIAQTNATIDTLRQTVANGDNALSQRIDTLQTDYNGNKASVANQLKTLSDKEQALATSQNQLTAKFDNLKIGGRNLLVDSEFTQGKWEIHGHDNQVTHRINNGILTLSSSIAYWKHAKLPVWNSYLDKELQVGETYTLSVWARSTQGQKYVFISIRNWKDGQFSENIAKREQVGETWQRIVVTGIYRQTPHNGQYLDVLLEHGEIGEVEFKQPKLEIGNVATDWTPAIQDNTAQTIITTATDLNTLTKTGKYFVKASTTNSPSQNWLFVDVENSGDDWIVKQTVTQDNAVRNQWVRQRHNGAWSAWEKLATGVDIANTQATINEVKQTIATQHQATASQLSTLQTTVQGQTASIQQHAQSLNGLSAQWTLKVQSGNIVSGIGLASSNGVSDFAVRADKFYIASPTGQKGDTPFTVLTSPQVINGVRVPAGTYIRSAYIQDGSIDIAKINRASINSLSALSANIGTLTTSDERGTFTYTGSRIELTDPNGEVLLRLGLL